MSNDKRNEGETEKVEKKEKKGNDVREVGGNSDADGDVAAPTPPVARTSNELR